MTPQTAAHAAEKTENEKTEKASLDYVSFGQEALKAAGRIPPASLSKASRDCAPCKPSSAARGTLYIVATPIGNLGDITLRALMTLADADAIACEDTRVTGGLLHRFGLKKTLIAYHDHNETEKKEDLLSRLSSGQSIALVSDAGTPLISDPGYKLVAAARARGIPVFALPGASALLTALASAGLPTDRFLFVGFLPPKEGARRTVLRDLCDTKATLVFYESPQRLSAALAAMADILGDRPATVSRELTKLFEETRSGTLAALASAFAAAPPKGEVVILVAPPLAADAPSDAQIDAALQQALDQLSIRDASASVAERLGLSKKDAYRRALALRKTTK